MVTMSFKGFYLQKETMECFNFDEQVQFFKWTDYCLNEFNAVFFSKL